MNKSKPGTVGELAEFIRGLNPETPVLIHGPGYPEYDTTLIPPGYQACEWKQIVTTNPDADDTLTFFVLIQ
jgi:hypothetical protein